jgi:hypothetical protein
MTSKEQSRRLEERKKLIGIEGPALDATDVFLCDSGGVVVTRDILVDAASLAVRTDIKYKPTRVHVCHYMVMAMEAWINTAKGTSDIGKTFNTKPTEKILGIEWVLHNEPGLEKEVFCLVEYEETTDDN